VIDSASPNPQPMRMLYGTLVSSPHELVLRPTVSDEPERGIFFVFPDVSVRTRGTYRLGIGLMRIAAYVCRLLIERDPVSDLTGASTQPPFRPPGDPANPPTHETLAFISTADFEITPLAEYVAPGAPVFWRSLLPPWAQQADHRRLSTHTGPTPLTSNLADQGVQMFLGRQ
jgi:hypothetical protein